MPDTHSATPSPWPPSVRHFPVFVFLRFPDHLVLDRPGNEGVAVGQRYIEHAKLKERVVGRALHDMRYVHVHDIARPRRKLHVQSRPEAEMGAPPDVPLKRLQHFDGLLRAFLDSEHRRERPRILQRLELVHPRYHVVDPVQPPPMGAWRIAEENGEDQLAAGGNFRAHGQKAGDPRIPPGLHGRLGGGKDDRAQIGNLWMAPASPTSATESRQSCWSRAGGRSLATKTLPSAGLSLR